MTGDEPEQMYTMEFAGIEQLRKSLTEMTENVARIVEPLTRWTLPVISPEVIALLKGPIIPPETLALLRGPIVPPEVFARFQEISATLVEEHRLEETIIRFGFVPHGELYEYFAELTRSEAGGTTENSEALANNIWRKIRPKLELALEGCLGDQRLFFTYADMLRAHEAGLYQLMAPNAVFAIERAAQLAQRNGAVSQKTFEWVNGLGELPCAALPRGWRAWVVLYENTFKSCWADADADAIPYVNRHAAAHGRGTKLLSVVDSLNAIFLAHFAITAAGAFEAYTRVEVAADSLEAGAQRVPQTV